MPIYNNNSSVVELTLDGKLPLEGHLAPHVFNTSAPNEHQEAIPAAAMLAPALVPLPPVCTWLPSANPLACVGDGESIPTPALVPTRPNTAVARIFSIAFS